MGIITVTQVTVLFDADDSGLHIYVTVTHDADSSSLWIDRDTSFKSAANVSCVAPPPSK